MRVVVAPDSFKGTITAADAARFLAAGWQRRRPHDEVRTLPLADGGEGTIDAFASASPDARRLTARVHGPNGRSVAADWLILSDGTAIVELAQSSGLPLMKTLDPLGAHTFGLGETIARALAAGCSHVAIALGGSASTDGGTGALRALGARFLDEDGDDIPLGGGDLSRLCRVEVADLLPPPEKGVSLLTDVTAPLLGSGGAAASFGPQKGATTDQVELLDHALGRLADVIGGDPRQPGAGAAGGTAFGLATLWNGRITAGAAAVASLVGLDDELSSADVVITGEGRFDATSLTGKVTGHVITTAAAVAPKRRCRIYVVAGMVGRTTAVDAIDGSLSLVDLAGSIDAATSEPARWLTVAGDRLARELGHR